MEKYVEADLLSVRTNTAAMKAAAAVTMSQRYIETSMERLSSGKRPKSTTSKLGTHGKTKRHQLFPPILAHLWLKQQ